MSAKPKELSSASPAGIAGLSRNDIRVLNYLEQRATLEDSLTPSVNAIVKATGLSRRTVEYSCKHLEDNGLLTRRSSRGLRTTFLLTVRHVNAGTWLPGNSDQLTADERESRARSTSTAERGCSAAERKDIVADPSPKEDFRTRVKRVVERIYKPVNDEHIAELCDEFFPDEEDLRWRLLWMAKEAGVAPEMSWNFFVNALRQFPPER